MTVSASVRRLVLATVAGEGYREDGRERIRQDIEAAGFDELGRVLSATHVAALFWSRFGELVTDAGLRDELIATLRNHQIYNSTLLAQLSDLRGAFAKLKSHRPVLLKGPSLWGWLYPDTGLRKTRDLDLLIQDRADLGTAVKNLKTLGFTGDFDAIAHAIHSHDHYELSVLVKDIEVAVDAEDDDRLQMLLARYPSRPDFTRLRSGLYGLRAEIELHKSFFLFTDGSYAPLPAAAIVPHELATGFARLTLGATIPYVASKFGMDTEGNAEAPPQPQSVKLLADFVRMLERAEGDDIARSIEFSKLWHCERYYARAVSTAAALLPEIEFAGIDEQPFDVDRLIEMAAE
jgi:Uncharacterised nucleotidyltransferase